MAVSVLAQAGHRGLDRGQRRAQVVGDRSHHGAAPTIDFFEEPAPQRLVLELCPFDGQRGLVGERSEQGPVLPGKLHLLEHQQPTGRLLATRATATRPGTTPPGKPSERVWPPPAVRDTISSARERLAGPGGDGEFGPSIPTAARLGEEQGRPARGEDGLHRGHDVVEQLREREIADQGLGELEEPVGVFFAPMRLLPGPPAGW